MEQVELNIACRAAEDDLREIQRLSEVDINKCYQCGTCAAGCPVAFTSDYNPRQIIRMLQLGLVEDVLRSKMIWMCIGCNICTTRCPRKLNIPRLNDTLRIMSKDKGFLTSEKEINIFGDLFLDLIEKKGRVTKARLALGFNLKTHQPFKDLNYYPKLFFMGKLKLLPTKVKGTAEIKRIFTKIREFKNKGGKH